jgi:lysophospholipase L1-like esterase
MNKKVKFILILSLALNFSFGVYLLFNKIIKTQLDKPSNIVIKDYDPELVTRKELVFYTGTDFEVKGRGHKEKSYNRLPKIFQNKVRKEVWQLAEYPSGISIRFRTNSTNLRIKWNIEGKSSSLNMSKLATSGIDLYCLIENKWQFVNSGIPLGSENDALLFSNSDTTYRTYLLNLPLFDHVNNVHIGIDSNAEITKPDTEIDYFKNPIVFYGSSITQGVGASRPGMAYPSIISRNMKVEVINLGFSGNGLFEKEVGEYLCNLEAMLFVIDCTPNSTPEIINKNAFALIQQLKKYRPEVPLLLVESIFRENSYFMKKDSMVFGSSYFIQKQNLALRKVYEKAKINGMNEIYYMSSKDLIGNDHESTIDGTHLSDLGSFRIAGNIEKEIEKIICK